MKISEQQLMDYMFCPAKFELKYVKGFAIEEPPSLSKLLNKVAKYFYINLFNGKACSSSELKNKWDSICKQNPDVIDPKKNIAGMGMILNLLRWAQNEQIMILDIDTRYNIVLDDLEVEGCMNPLLAVLPGKEVELLVTSFSSNIPDQINVDMKLKYSLDAYAFEKSYGKRLRGIRVHSVKSDKDILTVRGDNDYLRLQSTLKGVYNGIKHKAFFVSETPMCESCSAKHYCKAWYV